jgi:hypothetical protein
MRVKSGTEKLWKFITYLTGLEEKLSYTRETIEDELGVRFICGHNDFERKIINLHLNIVKDYKGVDWENSIILQVRDKDLAAQKKIFLDKVPPYLRSFYERIVSEEDRSRIELDNENLPKYYIEMRIPISTKVNGGNIFYRNQINILSYQWNHYKAIIKNYDSFTYKRRSEDWRDEHYTLFEWLVAREITPAILVGNSLEYANKTIDLRIKPYLKKHR